ncbi:MAG: hypothetical protein D6785_13420 [Planctomycetota bacterium]|nr:MAG: hypothetical protein D6785_13420 [Planctomycetota bacterium]
MKKAILLVLLIFFGPYFFGCSSSPKKEAKPISFKPFPKLPPLPPKKRPTAAIYQFSLGSSFQEYPWASGMQKILLAKLEGLLSQSGRFRLLDRKELKAML